MVPKTIHVLQEAHANALATNKDATQVVIAGRNIFKLFNIEDEEITEKLNLRIGKNLNLDYSIGDVVWSHHDDNLLATAATNGSVITWRLDKTSLSKRDMVFHDHRRTVHKVNFHPMEAHLLLSGSQDGTMKIFDLRKKEVIYTCTAGESVRAVEFNPFQHYMFAAVQENGHVQLWDLRRTDRSERTFTGHSGPVFACNWHPEEKSWLATAGRDNTIKIWDTSSPKFSADHTIHTISSVGHVKWRPQKKFHIASTSLLVDFSISVWDLRRPYIPLATFNEHKNTTTAIGWRNDPGVLLSTSKDNTLYQHNFRDAIRPADKAIPTSVDINCKGDVGVAMSNKLLIEAAPVRKESYTVTKFPVSFRRIQKTGEQVQPVYSTLQTYSNVSDRALGTKYFVKCAQKYRLTGRSISDLCEYNAAVATNLERHHHAASWSVLKFMFVSNGATSGNDVTRQVSTERHKSATETERVQTADSINGIEAMPNDQRPSRHQSGSNHRHHSGGKSEERQPGDTSTFSEEEQTENDEPDLDWDLANIASGMAYTRDYFLEEEGGFAQCTGYDRREKTNKMLNLEQKMELIDWHLPTEAFEPRIDLSDRSPPEQLMEFYQQEDNESEEMTDVAAGASTNIVRAEAEDQVPPLTVDLNSQSSYQWDCVPSVVDMMHYYAAQGDVQMCVTILIVLGDRIKNFIDEQIQDEWYQIYLELLNRFRLFTIANEIIKLSPLPSINSMNQQSTTIHTNCACGHPLGRLQWVCDRCKSSTNVCAVCHQIVKGLYVWCQGCSHGGHILHYQAWLKTNPACPAGCGHHCEFT